MMPFRYSIRKLSPEEATEFAARVAELTKAGLPLGAGLRALADELPGRRLPPALRDLADRLDAGDDLLSALESEGARLPTDLRGLMVAGVRSGQLVEVLEEYVDLQHSQSELRRRVLLTLAYPFILLLFMTAMAVFAADIVDVFKKIFMDFRATLPDPTELVLRGSRPVMWFLVSLVGVSIAIPLLLHLTSAAGWVWPAVYRLPMVGPLLRWGHLARFARLMSLLSDQQVSLPDALRLTAAGLRDARLAQGCCRAADDTEQGQPFDESLAARQEFPASLIPMVQWGRQASALPDAFRAAAEMFEGRVRSQHTLLETMLLPIMFLTILIFVGFFVIAVFVPLFSFITALSSMRYYHEPSSTTSDSETILIVLGILRIVLAVVLLGIAVIVLKHLRAGTFRALLRDTLTYLRILGCALIPVALFVLLALLFNVLGIIGWFILTFVLIEGRRKYRATQQHGLLWLLTASAERSMPLAPAVEAFARERGGWFGRRAGRLAELLKAGVPLPDALDRCPGLVPRYAVPTVRVGHETGALAESLRRAATVHGRDEPVWMALQGKIAYLLLLPAFGFALLTFIMIQIVPVFEKIFLDFRAPLPSLTYSLISVAHCTVQFWFLLFPLWLLGPVLLFYLPIRYFGWTDWDLPGMGRLTRRLDSAEILDTLALVAGRQRPLPEGVATLAHWYPKERIRRRLADAATDMTAGGDWCESLRRHGLIRQPEFAILQAAQRAGNLPWALKEMADSVRRRLAYRVQAAAQMAFPPIVILMGLVVLFIVVALFLPLVTLIQRLA